jgi:putative peptidoglycan lipid II flippase
MPDPSPTNPTPYPGSVRSRLVLAVYWLLLATSTHFPSSVFGPSEARAPDDPFILFQHDKVSHLLGFGGLALLLYLARPLGRHKGPIPNALATAAIALAYAPLDEFTQGILGNRHVSGSDLLANALAIVGVVMLALTPRRVPTPPKGSAKHGLAVLAGGLSLLALGGLVLAATRTLGRQTDALHLFAAAALAVTLLRRPPVVPGRPRLSAGLIASGVGLTLVGTEVAQAFARLPFARSEVMFGAIGLLIVMAGWSLRLAFGPATETTPTLRSHPPASAEDRAPNPRVADEPAAHLHQGPGDRDASARFVGHAVLVSALTLLSRLTGLARDAVLAAAFGLSTVADAFFIGFLVPNLFRRLFGEGALTAAFIPNYTELRERDPLLARRFASLVLTLLTVLLLAITGVAELGLWWAASAIDPASQGKAALAVHYTRIMLPYMPLICLVALAGGVLQVHKRFGPPAAAPLVLNAVIIAATVIATRGFSASGLPEERVGTTVALGVLVAGVLQLAWQLVVLHRTAGLTRCFAGVGPQVRAMLLMMGPMVIGLAVFQINALLDALIAFFFAPPEGAAPGTPVSLLGWTFSAPLRNGDVAALQWSQRLYQFPLGVFGIAIATAIFPALSAAAARFTGDSQHDEAGRPPASPEFAAILRQGLRLTVFIGLPASVGLLLVRVPLARVVYERGAFGLEDALRVSTILAGYATSVWAYSMMHTVTRAFYALKDATTPLKVGLAMVVFNLTLNLTLIWPLGAAGLAWSTAASAMLQVAVLVLVIRRRVPGPVDRAVLRSWGRTALASGVMAAVLAPVLWWLDPAGLSRGASAGVLAGATVVGAGVVLGIAKLAGAEELSWLTRRRRR